MKNVHRVSTKRHMGTLNQAIQKLFRKLGVLVHCLARTCESPTIPTDK